MRTSFFPRAVLAMSLALTIGCVRPQSLQPQDVLQRIADDYPAFFAQASDENPTQDLGLLRPRFGLPAIASTGAAFEVELLQRGEPSEPQLSLLRDGQAIPLRILSQRREPVAAGVVRLIVSVQPAVALPAQAYDLQLASQVDPPTVAPKAVWLRPASSDQGARPLRIAQLSDIHIGKGHSDLREHLERVIDDINARGPDLVLVTGDIANIGGRRDLLEEARDRLLRVAAPVVVVPGNHDLGFDLKTLLGERYGAGWPAFARVFHPHLLFNFSLDGWEFIGFDSGASVISPRILTRGLSKSSLSALHQELVAAQQSGRRGVVLFSHAPSRASVSTRTNSSGVGLVGRMRMGAAAFERELLDASQSLRVLHLSGHTHWADLFEAQAPAGERPRRFHRWPANALSSCLRPLSGQVALINAQSATHTTFHLRRNGQGYGYVWLSLDESAPQVAFVRFGGGVQKGCQESS